MSDFTQLAYSEGATEIRIRVSRVEWVPTILLSTILDAVEGALLVPEAREALELASSLGIGEEELEKLRDRIGKVLHLYRGYALQIESASRGSLVIFGVVAATSLFILKSTLGKTLEETWLESDFHYKLKKLLLRRINGRAEQIVNAIQRIGTVDVGDLGTFELSATIREERDRLLLDVLAEREAEEAVPQTMTVGA